LTEYFEILASGNYHPSTFADPIFGFPDLGIEQPPHDLTITDFAFPTTTDSPETIVGLDPGTLLPQHLAIDQALEEQFVGPGGDTQLSGEGTTGTSSNPSSSSPSSQSGTIHCCWPTCEKTFKNRSDYKYDSFPLLASFHPKLIYLMGSSHHCRYHNLPFQCPSCPSRQATKREFDRHINSVHAQKEKYYCTVPACNRSLNRNGKHFTREDGCRKHMKTKHRMTDDQVGTCGMDEETKKIRRQRKVARRAVN
jgi:hypothetical protein